MTKNQKTLLGVGVLAVAAYLVYQNNRPKTSFVNMGGKRNALGMGRRGAEPLPVMNAPCKRSPTGYGTATFSGKTFYQCCGNKWGTAPGETPCTKVPDKALTFLNPSDSTAIFGGR